MRVDKTLELPKSPNKLYSPGKEKKPNVDEVYQNDQFNKLVSLVSQDIEIF